MRRSSLCTAGLILAAAIPGQAMAPDTPEPGSREAIAKATTEERFGSPWVSYVPDHPTIPSPTDHLGHIVGAPGELTRTPAIYDYYRKLAAASDRVDVEVIGKSEEGREFLLVIIGEADSIERLDETRRAMARLADPRRTDDEAMEEIVATAKPFYMLHGGLHSTETGSPEMLMELAYRLAVSETPLIQSIREAVTVLINPVAEPDGRDRAVDWFYRHLKGKTDFERLPPHSPPYWGKYVFHDNNRDGYQRRLALTRATQDAFLRWLPLVVHDLHESIPLLSIWTGTGPYNLNLDPIVTTEWHAMAFHEVTALTSLGMPGVWTWGFGEGWVHGYADSVAINHNAIGRGYETFGNATAETVHRRLDPDSEVYVGKPVTEPDWYRTLPPPESFDWSLRNNINYQQTGALAALQYTALHADDMMRNFWRRGRNAVDKGRTESPFGVAIPEQQNDRMALAEMLNLLRAHGIEVGRCSTAFSVADGSFPPGTFLVRMDQPYRSLALDLLMPQEFPAEETPYLPYDDVGWALPFSMGVDVTPLTDEAARQLDCDLLNEDLRFTGNLQGSGATYVLRDSGQESLLAARFRIADFDVQVAEAPFSWQGSDYPAGTWLISGDNEVRSALETVSKEMALEVRAGDRPADLRTHALDTPRLAVLQTWNDTESAGWVRMVLDEREIPYTLIMDEDVRRGKLGDRFDVILYPHTYDSLRDMVHGIDSKHGPLAYTFTEEFPSHGSPTASDDITGGLTWNGIQHIEDFVRGGGVLITLGGASELPLDGGMARAVGRARAEGVFTPGSELRARFLRPDHPIAYGYPEVTSVFRDHQPLYQVRDTAADLVVMQWGSAEPSDESAAEDTADEPEPLVVSGGIKGANEVVGKPAILDVPFGDGHIVAFNFDPIHRYLTTSDFRLVWNVILNWNDLPNPME